MNLIVNLNRETTPVGTWGTKNENNYEVLGIILPEELEEYNKRIVYYLDNQIKWDMIIDNKVILTNAITKYDRVKSYVWLTKDETITLKYVCDGTEEGDYYFVYNNTSYYFTIPVVEENDELIFDVATSTLKLGDTTIETSLTGEGTELEFITIIDAAIDFRTKLFDMVFFDNENPTGIVPTQEEIDGFNSMISEMNLKIAEVDAKIAEVNTYIDTIGPILDRINGEVI